MFVASLSQTYRGGLDLLWVCEKKGQLFGADYPHELLFSSLVSKDF